VDAPHSFANTATSPSSIAEEADKLKCREATPHPSKIPTV
jgi:hypothetical protein